MVCERGEAALGGEAFLIRFADDAVLVFARNEDAERVMEVLPKRFGKYGLTVHPEKTRLIWFGKPQKREEGTSEPPRWGEVQLFGLHTLLGAESQRGVGGEAEDGIGSLHASIEKNHRVVQA